MKSSVGSSVLNIRDLRESVEKVERDLGNVEEEMGKLLEKKSKLSTILAGYRRKLEELQQVELAKGLDGRWESQMKPQVMEKLRSVFNIQRSPLPSSFISCWMVR